MLYRRWPPQRRKYIYNEKSQSVPDSSLETMADTPKKLIGIPLPNEAEDLFPDKSKRVHKPSIFDFIKNSITLEEIILIGLIILILDEGIEDEFILIMLIYVLLT